LSSGQLTGLLGGLKGAAEYETLVDRKGRGLKGMDSQSIVHLLLVGFIVLGNVILLYQRRKR
jgi:tetrahydromethanopterin S-methyltransferase subunit D